MELLTCFSQGEIIHLWTVAGNHFEHSWDCGYTGPLTTKRALGRALRMGGYLSTVKESRNKTVNFEPMIYADSFSQCMSHEPGRVRGWGT